MKKQNEQLAIASLVMGIIGIVSTCCCFLGVIFAILGITFALLSRNEGRLEGYAKAGFITSIIALGLTAAAFFVRFCVLGAELFAIGKQASDLFSIY